MGAKPAIVTRNIAQAADFSWGVDGTLAMITHLPFGGFRDCIRPGLSLLQPGFGLGEVSWTRGWGSKFAAGDEGGVSFDRLRVEDGSNSEHQFGGWRVCEGDRQLMWSVADAPLDEARCAEVKLMQEMQ